MKTCSRCLLLLTYSNYSRKRASADGYKSHCKMCEKVDRVMNLQPLWAKDNLKKSSKV